MHIIWATSWENLYMPYANNKGADQPAHPRSLISAFVVRCLDGVFPFRLLPFCLLPTPVSPTLKFYLIPVSPTVDICACVWSSYGKTCKDLHNCMIVSYDGNYSTCFWWNGIAWLWNWRVYYYFNYIWNFRCEVLLLPSELVPGQFIIHIITLLRTYTAYNVFELL